MNKVVMISIVFLLLGCAPKVKTEYIEVKVPVKAPITKPEKPVYTEFDTVFTYLPKVLNYTKGLEYTIDIYNESIDVTN